MICKENMDVTIIFFLHTTNTYTQDSFSIIILESAIADLEK